MDALYYLYRIYQIFLDKTEDRRYGVNSPLKKLSS